MARMLKLKWGSTELNLLAAEGAGWRAGAWNPAVAQVRYGGRVEPVVEVIEAVVERDSHDNLAASIQELGRIAGVANAYVRDDSVIEPVWLHAQMTHESGERRALVRSIDYELMTPPVSATGYANKNRIQVRLTIEREPLWERVEGYVTFSNVSINTVGGSLAVSNCPGDAPARLYRTAISGVSGSQALHTFWLGTRSEDKHGDDGITHFEPVWDCEDGDNLSGGDCSDVADSYAHGGYKVNCSFATASGWHERVRIRVTQVNLWEYAQAGRFKMLLRCKVVGSGTEVEVYAKSGWVLSDNKHKQDIVTIDNTLYLYKEIGVLQIPYLAADNYGVELWARRTTGSGSLDMDCIVMIPIDEAFISFEGANVLYPAEQVRVRTLEDGSVKVYRKPSDIDAELPFSVANWQLPRGDGMVVVAAQRATSQGINDNFNLSIQALPRWYSLRGSDGVVGP